MAIGSGFILGPHVGEEYKCDSNEALQIKLVSTQEEVHKEGNEFRPVMSHQVYGDHEIIFGYKELSVQLYYHAGSLLTYIGMKCKQKIPPAVGIPPDPVLPPIIERIPKGYHTNLEEFAKQLPEEDNFKPMGEKVHEYMRKDRTFEIYHADIHTPGLQDYHKRLQTFVLWYIDAASFIDSDDDKWTFFLLFEKIKDGSKTRYHIAGYTTIYKYFAYPDKYRPRISQMLVLPPFQKSGHGAELLDQITLHFMADPLAIDITVEDPSEDFVALRDYLDCKYCQKLDVFQKDKLMGGYTEEMTTAVYEKRKINKKQARRVYEILRFKETNKLNPTEYKSFRIDVKKRLNIPYAKQARDMEKLKNVLSEEEMQATLLAQAPEERIHRLDEAFKELEQEYERVVLRLISSS